MRDDSEKWDLLPHIRDTITGNGFEVSHHVPNRQTLISGPVKTSLALGLQTTALGWPDIATSPSYALRLRRDAILLLNGPKLDDGWHPNGVAISDMTGAYCVLEISGPRAIELLNKGTEINLNLPSSAVSRIFHGFTTLIYRWESPTSYRLHLPRCHAGAIWKHFENSALK